MNGKTAKMLRKYIYKDNASNSNSRIYTKNSAGTIYADLLRQKYQHLKLAWKRREI